MAEACLLGAYRPAHRLSDAQRHVRARLTVRDTLVRTRTRYISLVRALLRQHGWPVPTGSAEGFGRRVMAWRTVTWREGTRGAMRSRFARLRVRPAHRDEQRAAPRPEEWVLIEWPRGDAEPTKYWFSTLPAAIPLVELVHLAKLRWRIERDYQELKDELGLDHFEGRGWRGFHHHGALCIAAYAFLAAERARLSPPAPLAFLRSARLPKGFTPRGAPGAT